MKENSHVVIIAGPNGAGKSTSSKHLLRDLGIPQYVNADKIAEGLSQLEPDKAALQAGRFMLSHIKELARRKDNFAFETTLASRSFAPWIKKLCDDGYQFHLIYLWLPNEDFAVKRVENRVKMNGHNVPEDVIRRRYHAGIRNFFSLYKQLAKTWYFIDNSLKNPQLIAFGNGKKDAVVENPKLWQHIREVYDEKRKA